MIEAETEAVVVSLETKFEVGTEELVVISIKIIEIIKQITQVI